jgi:hypothetical protein
VLATFMRPVGGCWPTSWRSDHSEVGVSGDGGLMAIFLACPMMSTFTIGALGMAACHRPWQRRSFQAGA